MSVCDSDSGLSISLDGSHYGSSVAPSNGVSSFKLDIKVPDLNLKKSASLNLSETVGTLKRNLITTLAVELKDSMNYGLFIPPTDGKAGKFLQEERPLSEYGLHQNQHTIELRYKRRLYRCTNLNVTKLKKLHSKANLKLFMEYVGNADIPKVSKMLNKGLDPNFQIKETGETPLIKACSLVQPVDLIKILVEGGAHLDYRHSNGHTPLHAAAILGNLEAVKILLDLGQSPNTIDLEGLTPLYHSIISDPVAACAERLLYDYSIIGIEDDNGLQEIHQACRFGRTHHLEYLLQYKANINSQTSKNGNTPLHICAYLNQEDCARLLLFRGADRTVQNRAGHTPYQQALLSENKNIAILIQYYKDEDVVRVRGSPKYNEKRKPSSVPNQLIQRSRSASRLSDLSQLDKREDSGFNSQIGHYSERLKNQTRSVGKSGGQNIAITLREKQGHKTQSRSLMENKKLSRSANNLQLLAKSDPVPPEPNELPTESVNNWWLNWENEDTDGLSSVSGPSQRRTARAHSRPDAKKKSRSQSCKRRSSKSDLSGLVDIDTNFLPRVVVLQKNSQGFGFVIRGLKASSSINFRPTMKNPALQYFEEVEVNSVAARAGLKKGDFILEINNQAVISASHEETVRLIKASGDILAMKVVTVNKNKLNEQRKCFDYALSSMDDSSDKSSIISSEVQSQRLSTFSRTTNRSDSFSIANRNTFAPANNSNKNQYKPILNSSMSNHSQISPSIFSQKDVMPMTDIRVRRNTIATNVVRPDSILSTDSFYPMPPPPLSDFSPFKQLDKDNVDDCTLKRSKTYPTPAYIPEDIEDCNFSSVMSPNDLVNVTNNPVPTPPVPPPPPQNIAPPALAPPPPQPPPPPPPAPPPPPGCVPPPPSLPLSNVPKPILKLPKPTPKPPAPAIHPTLEFDSHFRQALAKRRQKIDSDQNSVASFDIGDNVSKGSLRITPSALKQNETYTRSASNKWTNVNSKEHEISNINGNNPFQRTRSDVYSANTLNNVRKTDDNTSRLYLI